MIDILKGTPLYVYFLLAYVLKVALGNLKEKKVKMKKIIILPILFLFANISLIWKSSYFTPLLFTFIIMFSVGLLLGNFCFRDYLKNTTILEKEIVFPPSVLLFGLIIFKLIFRYAVGYESAVNPQLMNTLDLQIIVGGLSAISTGLFCYRSFYVIYKKVRI